VSPSRGASAGRRAASSSFAPATPSFPPRPITSRRTPSPRGRSSTGNRPRRRLGVPDVLTIALQQAINGMVLGSLYVLVALGLTLIYGVLVQINFAHADIVTLGAFAAYFFTHRFGGHYLASIVVALAVGAVLGWLINSLVFVPLRHRGSELLPLIATI